MRMTLGTRRRWRLLAAFCCSALAITLFAPLAHHGATAQDTAVRNGTTTTAPPADTTPPVLSQPTNLVVAADGPSGTVVRYRLPQATDNVDGSDPVSCDPATRSLFPLGSTTVVCTTQDRAGNQASVSFLITVTDQTRPVISRVPNIIVNADSDAGVIVSYAMPTAGDNVDGSDPVTCNPPPGSQFPVGDTTVTCTAQDAAGNQAYPSSFIVVVRAPQPTPTPVPTQIPTPTPVPTDPPTPTAQPTAPPTATATATSDTTDGTTETGGGSGSNPPTGTTTTPTTSVPPLGTPSGTAIRGNLATAVSGPKTSPPLVTPDGPHDAAPADATPSQPALTLPDSPPGPFTVVTDGGPLGILAAIWGNQNFPISQEFGHTDFSIGNYAMYAYGLDYGLDGYEHPGIDIGMPRGTWLYSPIDGTVVIAGGVPYYTFYGNGQPGVGELMIQDSQGNEVILGHMGRIAVAVGQQVKAGQFVGLSGGAGTGDHVHLETRARLANGDYMIVDPRKSFLVNEMRLELGPRETVKSTESPALTLGFAPDPTLRSLEDIDLTPDPTPTGTFIRTSWQQ